MGFEYNEIREIWVPGVISNLSRWRRNVHNIALYLFYIKAYTLQI